MSISKEIRLSKAMSYALRHRPEEFGLTLDKDGWTSVEDLIKGIIENNTKFGGIGVDDIIYVVESDDKKRYEINGEKIRAVYGHSIKDKIEKIKCIPPEILYHGTTEKAYDKIKTEGLKPMQRQYVHYSKDILTAINVANRRTNEPVLLEIEARKASEEGINFYEESTGIYLGDRLPTKYIRKK